MPTVLQFDGLRAVIYPNDHRPAHVHVIGPDKEAVFALNCPDGPSRLSENYGFARRELRTISAALDLALESLCRKWETIHGRE
ncbi:MAG TPA: DUF4160 domain-containing protein [Rhizomicrobium sp.]|jgi:hypothetical protein|nr:DUF4160 domain-containing protein [Rhizomicrobium sp.]